MVGEIAIKFAKHFRLECRLHRLSDFTQARPQIAQKSLFPVFIFAERFSRKIDIYPASQRKRDHQGRRHQKIRLDVLMHARLKISIPRKHRGCNQIEFVDRFLDIRMERSGVADAGGATVADEIKSQFIEVFLQPGFVEIVGNNP